MENRVTDVLKNLRDKKEISIEQYNDLSSPGSRLGIIYGSVKVYKTVIDSLPFFRPILSAIGTPTYKLANLRSPCKLNSLLRYKYPLKKKIRSEIVYRYTCSNCKVSF